MGVDFPHSPPAPNKSTPIICIAAVTMILLFLNVMFNPAYYGLDNTEPEFDIKWIRTA
ncbi:unnamed protein product [Prunus armeniaca]